MNINLEKNETVGLPRISIETGSVTMWIHTHLDQVSMVVIRDNVYNQQFQVQVDPTTQRVVNMFAFLVQTRGTNYWTIDEVSAIWMSEIERKWMLRHMRAAISHVQGSMPDWAKPIWREAKYLVMAHILVNDGEPRYGARAAGNVSGAPRPKPLATIRCNLVVEFGTLASVTRALPICRQYAEAVFVTNNNRIDAYDIDVADLPALLKALNAKVGTTVTAHVMSNWE